MNKNSNYFIDQLNGTIILTKRFYKAASVLNSPEYKELMQARRDNPTFSIVLREIKKKEGKKAYQSIIGCKNTCLSSSMAERLEC